MDKYELVDQNWYSLESQKEQRAKDYEALKRMKEFEKLCMEFRTTIIKKTEHGGIRTKYVKEYEKQK